MITVSSKDPLSEDWRSVRSWTDCRPAVKKRRHRVTGKMVFWTFVWFGVCWLVGSSFISQYKLHQALVHSMKGTYTVQPGDTLWGISSKFTRWRTDEVEDVIGDRNHLVDGQVAAGQMLIVPMY